MYVCAERKKLMENKTQIIDLYENKDQVIRAAIDCIAVEIYNNKESKARSQSILLTGCSPLAGTTSTCIGLSIALANTKRETLLIDCDVRKSNQYKKLGGETIRGLGDYLIQEDMDKEKCKCDLDSIICNTNIENLSFIPCGKYIENSTRVLCSQKMNELIAQVKERFDYVVFDFPSLAIVPDAQIFFNNVDGIILVSSMGETTKSQVKEAKRKIKTFSSKYYGMIINKLDISLYRKYVKDYDYYFLNKNGEQKLRGNTAKKYKKNKVKQEAK